MFGRAEALVGMVHVGALPGTPRQDRTVAEIAATARDEARLLVEEGFDAILLENMHDVPYLRGHVGPEIVAAMTSVTQAVRDAIDVPLGVQILAGANEEALAVAHAAGAQFVRVEGFVFGHVADEGLFAEADAGPLLRYRKQIGAESVGIIADVKKKHSSHALTADVDLAETTRAADFFGADGIIVTGVATGRAVSPDDLAEARSATDLPLLVGSGVTPESAQALFAHADALIVGSWYKQDGFWSNPPDRERVCAFVRAARGR